MLLSKRSCEKWGEKSGKGTKGVWWGGGDGEISVFRGCNSVFDGDYRYSIFRKMYVLMNYGDGMGFGVDLDGWS